MNRIAAIVLLLMISAPAAPVFAQSDPVVHCNAPRDDEERALCRDVANDPAARVPGSRGAPPGAYRPSASDCPEGRALRAGRAWPTNMSDCDVLKAVRDREEFNRNLHKDNEDRRVKAEQTEHDKRQHEIDEDQKLGYTSISFEDFVLDGKDLAKTEKKIALLGTYIKLGNVEYVFPSQIAAMMANNGTAAANSMRVGLLTDDAPRELRAYYLRCNSSPASSVQGCWTRVRGHATICNQTMLLHSETVPCLVVEGGWSLVAR
ncbi:MAG TPA: hypothetical protein VIJ52_00680 [Pseudolabrys sp.]